MKQLKINNYGNKYKFYVGDDYTLDNIKINFKTSAENYNIESVEPLKIVDIKTETETLIPFEIIINSVIKLEKINK